MERSTVLKHVGSLLVFSLFILFAAGTTDSDSNSNEIKQPATPKPKPPPKPEPAKGTVERLSFEIKNALGESNRKVPKVSKSVINAKKVVAVVFAVDDNLTNNMVKQSAKIDIKDILKAVKSSDVMYSKISIIGTFSLVDKFGNAKESEVVRADYTRTTVDRINWKNFLFDNIYKISDKVWLHPAFK